MNSDLMIFEDPKQQRHAMNALSLFNGTCSK